MTLADRLTKHLGSLPNLLRFTGGNMVEAVELNYLLELTNAAKAAKA